MRKIIIGVMGPGNKATEVDLNYAYQLGQLIAQNNWILLTGGRKVGVMDAASQGAKSQQGLTIGILPHQSHQGLSDAVDIAIVTDLGNGRNNVNVLSSDVIVACGMGLGTASEIALALKNGKPVVLLTNDPVSEQFFRELAPQQVFIASDPVSAIERVQRLLSGF